jgi:hypothetical protein
MKTKHNMRLGLGVNALALAAFGFSPSAGAESLSALLPNLLKSHQLVKASTLDLSAATERTREARGGFFRI